MPALRRDYLAFLAWRAGKTACVFGGDGIGMVIAALLMATFFFGKWDRNVIPFGEIEGVGESDPVRLTTEFGSLAALAAVYAWGVMRARRKALEAARSRS